MEMTPSLVWCSHKCKFCWRPLDFTIGGEPRPDEPSEIIDGCIKERRMLLTGFKGFDKVDKKKWEEATKPTNAAISLAGEPTMYSRISDMLAEFKRRNFSTFLVTNGTRPDRLKSLSTEPTNLYISLCAPDKETYLKVNRPTIGDGWKKVNESLELMNNFGCRTVLRLTLVKGLNLKSPEKYAALVKKAGADIVEPKGYSWVGESRQRLGEESVPTMEDMREFSKALADKAGYDIADEDEPSKVFLLKR
jgi:tRNA wybutosine-synthesizing protein 1